MTVAGPRSRPAPRLTRAIASALAWALVVGMLLGLAHRADARHATLTDGTVVHVDLALTAEVHAGCQDGDRDHSGTVDRHTPPVAPADPCWLCDATQAGFTARPPLDQFVLAIAQPTAAVASPRPPTAAAVLHVAPKTSPPV